MMCSSRNAKLGDVAQMRGNLAEALQLQEAGQAVVRAWWRIFPNATICAAIWR